MPSMPDDSGFGWNRRNSSELLASHGHRAGGVEEFELGRMQLVLSDNERCLIRHSP